MVCPILISVSETPGRFAGRASALLHERESASNNARATMSALVGFAAVAQL